MNEDRCILAMQQRVARNPIRDFLWRRPWRSSGGVRGLVESMRGRSVPVALHNAWQWFAHAHDCSDPAVGCSCHPSFRFPSERRDTSLRACKQCGSTAIQGQPFSGGSEYYCPSCDEVYPFPLIETLTKARREANR